MKHLLAVLFVYEMLLHVGQGNQYYIAAMRNLYGMTNNYFLHITTMSQHTVVFHIDGYTEHITDGYVSRGSPATISLDIDLVATDNTQRHKGIHIYTNDSDINVLVINDLSEFGSTGDYIAIPYKVYSTEEYIYYAVSSSSKFSFLQSLVLLVGTEDNTSITITPTVSIAVPQDPQDIGSSQITIAPDITGTKIVSNKPVTVISGHECGTIPANRGFCEHLTVQIPPTITWGQTFILNPHTSISESHIYQIIVSEPNTSVTRCYSDNQTIVDNTSMQFSFNSTNCFMNSSNPVLVIEFGLGSQMGNPVISIVPPVAQYTTNIVFYTPNVVRDGHFINIATTQRDVMLLNGRIMDVTWSPVFNGASNAVGYTAVISNILPNTDYTVATMNNHSLSVMVYGFDFDTSYSYNVVSGVVKGQAPMIRECPDGMYSSDGTCVNCQTEQDNPSCQIVQDEAPMIRECPDGMYLSGGTCVNCQTEQDNPSCQIVQDQAPMIRECPDGMYLSGGTCVHCQTEQDNPSCQIVPFEVSIAEDAFYIMGASVLAIFRSNKPWIVALCKLSDGMHHTDYTDCSSGIALYTYLNSNEYIFEIQSWSISNWKHAVEYYVLRRKVVIERPIQCDSLLNYVDTDITVYGSIAIVEFTISNIISETECSLDLGHYYSCTSPLILENLAPGIHLLMIKPKNCLVTESNTKSIFIQIND